MLRTSKGFRKNNSIMIDLNDILNFHDVVSSLFTNTHKQETPKEKPLRNTKSKERLKKWANDFMDFVYFIFSEKIC